MTNQYQEYEYSYQSSQKSHHHSYLKKPILELLNELPMSLPPNRNKRKISILDLGCGNGSFSNIIAQAGYEVTGVDDSPSGIKFAQQTYGNCQFIQESTYDISPEKLGKKFDVIIAIDVIEHLFYPKELAKVAKKCLNPDGYLIVTTPYNGYWKNLALSIMGKWDQHLTVLWDGGHIKFFSIATLTELLKSQGFSNINFKFAGRLPFLWKDMICYSHI
ncbi:class I SAM-dependent methyltransferase [Cyanobacterium sp. Dongsha4]|uniref:class I SAM-dependent methyltransferase n=1 Tax=Cyanobacterium sp. DS4 TaxID=2878255 RepID=UPI002E80543F|nr:class I SAM-dependent methyltransferase [Cyanobacterium sp. Dongsha4]WVK99557.1 class I SAM-dependent methyltransferase [Cyanobacterium sp. Dongsha4]